MIRKGFEKGSKEQNIQNAKNFLELGVDIEIISKGTGLSIEEVKELRKVN